MAHLLDANVLIALLVDEHEHHDRVSRWVATVTVDGIAVCPVVEGALVRFLVRLGESAAAAAEVLRQLHEHPGCQFWPDSVTYADVDLGHVRGHRQVTDAYLAGLAVQRGSLLATLDQGLADVLPEATFLVPPT